MNKQTRFANRRRRATRAFTLIELLAVMVIIVLLVGILVPAVGKVRQQALVTSTRVTLGVFQTGLETFRADGRVGGGYPPSRPNRNPNAPADRTVESPYATSLGISEDITMTGAGLLVWSLAGADLLGTPGYKVVRSDSSHWADDTDDRNEGNNDPSQSGLYALRNDTQQPLHPRSGPYVDLSKVRVTHFNQGTTSFDIEAEVAARKEMDAATVQRKYPMFLDAFGFPILYWRADPAGVVMADRVPLQGNQRGIYHRTDNLPLISEKSADAERLILRPGGRESYHRLEWGGTDIGPHGGDIGKLKPATFDYYIHNAVNKIKVMPHNPDTYLLVSPGPDGLYGTSDDIANFEHNGVD